jgi:elongator complex protein 3
VQQVPVKLNTLTADQARKRKLPVIPKLMDIIAAVPEEYKPKLLPYIKSKPVRTASGRCALERQPLARCAKSRCLRFP